MAAVPDDDRPERMLASLAGRIMSLERYTHVSEDQTHEFVEQQKNKNTLRKTQSDVKLFTDWLVDAKKERRSLDIIPVAELDKNLAMFMLSIKKSNGESYEPDSMISKFNSIGRYLREKRRIDLNRDVVFSHSRDVLSKKCKQLKEAGMGSRSKKAEAFTPEEVTKLKDTNELSTGKYGLLCVIISFEKGVTILQN